MRMCTCPKEGRSHLQASALRLGKTSGLQYNVSSSILGPALLVRFLTNRALFAIADRGDPVFCDAHIHKVLRRGIGLHTRKMHISEKCISASLMKKEKSGNIATCRCYAQQK